MRTVLIGCRCRVQITKMLDFLAKCDPTPALQKHETSILKGIAIGAAVIASGGTAAPAIAAGIAATATDVASK